MKKGGGHHLENHIQIKGPDDEIFTIPKQTLQEERRRRRRREKGKGKKKKKKKK